MAPTRPAAVSSPRFTSVGLGSTLAPGVLWARMQDAGADRVTLAMVTDALKLSGIELAEADRKALVDGANTNLERLEELRAFHIPNDVSPPYHFSPVVPGMTVDRARRPVGAEQGAGAEAPGQPRRRGVLAGAPPGRARPHEAGDVGRADAHVPGAAAPLQRQAEQRRHVPRRPRPGRGDRRRPRDRGRHATKGRCTASPGAARTSSR